ncbi:MAG: TenA family protein [Richelia sp. SL_2_1]|nr:TenA family protein [Richelia sp. RM1_1_1]NJO30932.1 TenA family protein [Richelia sp. SL_2_1]
MSISDRLWKDNHDLASCCLQHPFVQGIASGNLERQKFAYYVGQDAFFLKSFARAYSIAAAKSPDFSVFTTFHHLAGGVLQELQLHQSYAREWDVDLQVQQPGNTTRRYTDFLLATAWGGDIGLIAAAMSPCMTLYAFLGTELARDGIPNHQYADWIRTYSSSDFQPLTEQLANLLDTHASNTATVASAYRYAMLCELDFFQAAWEGIGVRS